MPIGLTGGVASGKSQVGQWFSKHGWAVFCSDEIVHELYEPGQALPGMIAQEFGKDILTVEGRVDRHRLGKKVFGNETALGRLNAMVHPQVQAIWRSRASEAAQKGLPSMVVVPLLYEAQVAADFDEVWVVACSVDEQKRRMALRGLDENQVRWRLAAQWPLQKKIDLADRVIWNNADWELTKKQLQEILKQKAAA